MIKELSSSLYNSYDISYNMPSSYHLEFEQTSPNIGKTQMIMSIPESINTYFLSCCSIFRKLPTIDFVLRFWIHLHHWLGLQRLNTRHVAKILCPHERIYKLVKVVDNMINSSLGAFLLEGILLCVHYKLGRHPLIIIVKFKIF